MRNDFNKNKTWIWLEYAAVAIIVIAFFVISRCGFYNRDDYAMVLGDSPSLSDVLNKTGWFYLNLGGRCFSVFSQYVFSGWLGNKIWFDIVNTLFFALLIVVCGKLVNDGKKESIHYVLVFSLLFWFLCPVPRETLFWVAGATTYLWACTLTFVFLLCFQKYKDDNFSIVGKMGLFLMSIVCATEFISCASICGAFVVYYLFHLKEFKGNVIPFVAGFAIGSMLVLFAPGNFLRASYEYSPYFERISNTFLHPIREITRYKAVWLFLFALVWGWKRDQNSVKVWVRKNSVLILSLLWSIIAISLVFTPVNRASFFTESVSLVLFLSLLYHSFGLDKVKLPKGFKIQSSLRVNRLVILLFFSLFLLDSVLAVREAIRQNRNNDRILTEIKEANGVTGTDLFISSHRMAYPPKYINSWGCLGIAYRLGLDSVVLYPYYCQDKYYTDSSFGKNIYVDYQGLLSSEGDGMTLSDYGIIFIRLPENKCQNQKEFSVTYTKKKKWYKIKQRNSDYNWNRTHTIQREAPDTVLMNMGYYFIWMKKDDLENLKRVDCEYE